MKANSHQISMDAQKRAIVTDRAVKVLASSIFRQLQDEGCQPKDIISVSSQLLDLVTSELQKDSELPQR